MRISDWSSDVCSSDLLLQRLDALGEGGVLGREGDSIRDTALLHEGLQLSTRLLSRIRPRLLGVDAAKQICPALRDRRLSVIGDPAVLLFCPFMERLVKHIGEPPKRLGRVALKLGCDLLGKIGRANV